MKKNNTIELPDIQEFLKVSRIFSRQLNLIKKNNIPGEYKDLINIALLNVSKKIEENI